MADGCFELLNLALVGMVYSVISQACQITWLLELALKGCPHLGFPSHYSVTQKIGVVMLGLLTDILTAAFSFPS